MPIRIEFVGLKALQSDLKRLERGLKDYSIQEVRRAWALAAAAFVRVSVQRVLVDTGMSVGTYIPLSKAISATRSGATGLENLVRQQQNRGTPGKLRFDRPEFPTGRRRRPPRKRSFGAGKQEGKEAYRLNMGRGTTPLRFFFAARVFQFAYWEFQQRALEAGEAAFIETFNREIAGANKSLQQFIDGRRIRPRVVIRPGDL